MNAGIAPPDYENEPDPGDSGDSGAPGGEPCMACVPLDSISVDGTPPSMGDHVDFSIGGTVKSVDGQNAMVAVEEVNGEAVSSGSGDDTPGANETTAQMGARLRGKAQAATDAQNTSYGG